MTCFAPLLRFLRVLVLRRRLLITDLVVVVAGIIPIPIRLFTHILRVLVVTLDLLARASCSSSCITLDRATRVVHAQHTLFCTPQGVRNPGLT